ncbi:MAG: GNAT superfamily N-acetyltransferase [Flavobacterium sp.]|jgi:GNAT superfamily N-acetyltransferase
MIVALAIPDDLYALASFARTTYSDAFGKEKLVGFVQIGIVDRVCQSHLQNLDPTGIEIRRLYVLASDQGRGVGSALIEQALSDPMIWVVSTKICHLDAKGPMPSALGCKVGNDKFIACYARIMQSSPRA